MYFFAGQSEHDLVKYKLGYDIGPSNPFPTNEPEKEFYDAQRAQEEKKEAFEELKKQSEAEKKEREVKFRKENLIPESDLKPPGEDDDDESGEGSNDGSKKGKKVDPKELDPDNPDNYVLPEDIMVSSATCGNFTIFQSFRFYVKQFWRI